MGRHIQMRNRTDILDRIVILLLALAGLAERVAGAPALVRCLVLCPLRLADTIAAEFVAGFGTAYMALSARSDQDGFAPTDALAIAVSLRTLALTLQAVITQIRLSSQHPRSSKRDALSIHRCMHILDAVVCPEALCLDTS